MFHPGLAEAHALQSTEEAHTHFYISMHIYLFVQSWKIKNWL